MTKFSPDPLGRLGRGEAVVVALARLLPVFVLVRVLVTVSVELAVGVGVPVAVAVVEGVCVMLRVTVAGGVAAPDRVRVNDAVGVVVGVPVTVAVVEGVCVRVAVDETVRVAVEEADNAEREPVCVAARDAEGVGEPAARVRVHVADCDCASALRG